AAPVNTTPESHLETETIAQTQAQLAVLVEEVIQLSLMPLTATEFYQEFLKRILQALAVPLGTVWVREEGHFRQQCRMNPGRVPAETIEDARPRQTEALQQGLQQGRPLYLPSATAASPQNGDSANGHGWAIVIVPVILRQQVESLLELWLGP